LRGRARAGPLLCRGARPRCAGRPAPRAGRPHRAVRGQDARQPGLHGRRAGGRPACLLDPARRAAALARAAAQRAARPARLRRGHTFVRLHYGGVIGIMVVLKVLARVLDIIVLPAVLLSLGLAFLYAPPEATMHDVYRIFYFHVPATASAGLGIAIVFVCSIL